MSLYSADNVKRKDLEEYVKEHWPGCVIESSLAYRKGCLLRDTLCGGTVLCEKPSNREMMDFLKSERSQTVKERAGKSSGLGVVPWKDVERISHRLRQEAAQRIKPRRRAL